MMYSEKLAVAIKVNGKVLREGRSADSSKDDTVFIPFGSEFSIFVKNMNSVRALVRFEIDGTDATDGVSIIVPANGSIELERFIKNGNFQQGLRFKFIERTKKIEDGPRGIKAEDGLIRVEYEFEREPSPIKTFVPTWNPEIHHHHHYNRDAWTRRYLGSDTLGTSVYGDYLNATAAFSANATSASTDVAKGVADMQCSATMDSLSHSPLRSKGVAKVTAQAASVNDKGITVGGSKSDQSFQHGSWFPTDGVKHVMVIQLRGETGGKKIAQPILVSTKIECPTCGKRNKSNARFCPDCGSGLEKV